MKTKMFLSILVTLLLSTAVFAQAPQWKNADYDAVRDFSLQSNPNGVWSYGWEDSLGGPLNLYAVPESNCRQGFSEWRRSADCQPPGDSHNDTGKQICDDGMCWPPAYMYFHPGPNGELSIVRWTAPSSGKFLIQGGFMGIDQSPTTTDVHVLLNSKKSLLNGPITSYKWPLTFNLTVKVSVGDTVDFAVGFGKDGHYESDSTALRFAVTHVGKN